MSMAVHCDRDECDTWQRTGDDLPTGWWILTASPRRFLAWNEQAEKSWAFCTLDCLMHWAAARSTPTETYGA
ncbi:hypothetical protein [Nocardia sp. NPDC051833]|uniref:hypothetical protein n=1 Tax=Nocardia sp. NPDC051833 TaxID=3155674 RepID=UPI0034150F56